MSVPNPPLADLQPLSLPVEPEESSAAAHATRPWLNWCTSVIDHAFGFDLCEAELRELSGTDRTR